MRAPPWAVGGGGVTDVAKAILAVHMFLAGSERVNTAEFASMRVINERLHSGVRVNSMLSMHHREEGWAAGLF